MKPATTSKVFLARFKGPPQEAHATRPPLKSEKNASATAGKGLKVLIDLQVGGVVGTNNELQYHPA
jgi:hypothetical protein